MTKRVIRQLTIALLFTSSVAAYAQMSPPRQSRTRIFVASAVSEKQSRMLDSIAASKLAMEDFPADNIYEGTWSCEGVNAGRLAVADVKDSVRFNLKGFVFPVEGEVTSVFGPRGRRYHYGYDLSIDTGDTIVSCFPGMVRVCKYDHGGYGWYVVVRHTNGLETVYGHLSKIEVEEGQSVKAGQLIALGGNTGRSTGPHLHFETRFQGNPINPANLIDFEGFKVHADSYFFTKSKDFCYARKAAAIKARANAARFHKVKNGETLSHIAEKRGTTVSKLRKLNRLSKNAVIRPGQRIRYS